MFNRCYKVVYINWKGKELIEYIYASNITEARKDASVIQGLEKILKIEVAE